MKYKITKRFEKDIQKLDPVLIESVLKTISKVADSFGGSPLNSLNIEKVEGFWSARVNNNFRIIFNVENDVITFYRVTNHDIYKRRSQ